MKKFLSIVITLVGVTCIITGCGNTQGTTTPVSTSQTTTIQESTVTETTSQATPALETTASQASETTLTQETTAMQAASQSQDTIVSQPQNITTSQTNSSEYISKDEAKKIVLANAGFVEESVTLLKTELDEDDGVMIYEVDFICDDVEYDYEINAITGAIIKSEKEQNR